MGSSARAIYHTRVRNIKIPYDETLVDDSPSAVRLWPTGRYYIAA